MFDLILTAGSAVRMEAWTTQELQIRASQNVSVPSAANRDTKVMTGRQCLFIQFKLLIPEGQRRPRGAEAIRFDLIQDFICFVEGIKVKK